MEAWTAAWRLAATEPDNGDPGDQVRARVTGAARSGGRDGFARRSELTGTVRGGLEGHGEARDLVVGRIIRVGVALDDGGASSVRLGRVRDTPAGVVEGALDVDVESSAAGIGDLRPPAHKETR